MRRLLALALDHTAAFLATLAEELDPPRYQGTLDEPDPALLCACGRFVASEGGTCPCAPDDARITLPKDWHPLWP